MIKSTGRSSLEEESEVEITEREWRSLSISLCPLRIKKKKKSPDSSVNAIAAAFVVEMRCKDGH